MKLYLSSYKLGNKVDYLKKWISENGRKILLIVNARDAKVQDETEKKKVLEKVEMLEQIGFEVKLLDLKLYFNNYDKLVHDISCYKAFCVTGGNVFVLRKAMMLSGFDKYLKSIKDKDYLYVGYSAGVCVLTNSLEGYDIVDNPINPYNSDKIIYDGVGLINYNIVPHYKSLHEESLLVDKLVLYLDENNLNYKTLRDGEVFIDEIK